MERMEGTTLSTGLAKGASIAMGYELHRTIELPKPDQPESILRSDVHGECERMDDALERSKQDLSFLSALANNNPSIGLGVRKLSVSPSQASGLRSAIKSMDQTFASELVKRALVCRSPQGVRELLFLANRSKLHGESDQHSQPTVESIP